MLTACISYFLRELCFFFNYLISFYAQVIALGIAIQAYFYILIRIISFVIIKLIFSKKNWVFVNRVLNEVLKRINCK